MSRRTHTCGEQMSASAFAHTDPTPRFRSQPIWMCFPCNAWEPRDGWDGLLPEGWDGQTWTQVTR